MPYNSGALRRNMTRPPTSFTTSRDQTQVSPSVAKAVNQNAIVGGWGAGIPQNIIQGMQQANSMSPAPNTPAGNNPVAPGGKGKGKRDGIARYLAADEDYQNTINDLQKNFQDYRGQNILNRNNVTQDFGDTRTRLAKQESDDFKRLQAEFAARGLFGSGLYEGDRNDFQLGFQNQQNDARTSFNRNISQLLTDLASSQTLYRQQLKDAKLSALRRRAEKLGIRN